MPKESVFVNDFTNGILDPNGSMLGPVKDGGIIVANTAPGCWGPMITPALRGGHEVTRPVFVENAEIGDAVAIYIKSITVTSSVASSGNEVAVEKNFVGDPFVAGRCPNCGTLYPETKLEGIGSASVHCAKCDEEIAAFQFTNGYTIALNENKTIGVTLTKEASEEAAKKAKSYMAVPDNSIQNPVVTFAPHDIVGNISRLKPFIGQLGTTPSIPMPDSHNAGDFGSFLLGAPHEYALTEEELLKHKTDGHMDINRAREGAIVICPVKVKGGGVYVGDVHAMQGDGEIAGHTCDVSSVVTLKVKVIKNLNIDGPIILPVEEDLPYLAKPLNVEEKKRAMELASEWGIESLENTAPISFVGTGSNLNEAIDNGLTRAAELFNISVPEVKNRTTINGAVEIGRYPGTATVTFLAPIELLEKVGIYSLVKEQYNLI
ncbi:acetamidase/formamidase [Gottschalkia acidurici 9a]|uniref:Acetamidase/formamidase n=1 Tax=Gottschalkia acidurici (strain ATCC 7906 / DSM 604 / BCRC 14475 / CIP 104303 / KCTC 5404 / NCIMB 10678 / 9a) TaxID=1128398 RepID=K0AYI4_GOTA9|nr:acetamidase/formamidase family protein [Gottschalkia acidurici]AFS77832.1 acetamidase/formamidase [Gottschalkia acidurici 9a]